ncbi:MAG: PspC domain-containing protein [Candidatus Omnitrophota bacterium]
MRRIYRNNNERVIAGICSGLAEAYKIDPLVFRMIFVSTGIFFGSGGIIYVMLWALLPRKKEEQNEVDSQRPPDAESEQKA